MSFVSARRRSGLSQRAVAKELNISAAAVALWEVGKTKPRAALLPQIAKLYGCPIDELLAQEEMKEKT